MFKPLLKKDIEYAQSQTRSHHEASRYLNISFSTYKKWAKDYGLYYNEHMNRAGKGVSKARKKGLFGLNEILEGKHPNYDRTRLRDRLIATATIVQRCHYCGVSQVRPDGKGPYTLDYADGNRMNLSKDNLRLICYNCSYLTTGRVAVVTDDPIASPDQDYEEILGTEELEKLRNELMGI